jgi:hypothetical protein
MIFLENGRRRRGEGEETWSGFWSWWKCPIRHRHMARGRDVERSEGNTEKCPITYRLMDRLVKCPSGIL